MSVIKVENLGKKYRIGGNRAGSDGLRHAIHDLFTNPLRKARNGHSNANPQSSISNPQSEEFWALKDVSFEVKQGEVVGIIGRNGAGKSTLLKILSRITEPTTGRLGIRGRVASLLEVGTGFHPELTGRENVFLNGAILGMTREEIKRKFDEIVAFAEIEKFIDTPVKRYSSGMYVRLAFAVAAHLEPEILIVDEVLAVGDLGFQKKCLGKMEQVGIDGRTVLFVSHNMNAVMNLCSRSIWLEEGKLTSEGVPNEIISEYLTQGGTFEATVDFLPEASTEGGEVTILSGTIYPQTIDLDNSTELSVQFTVKFNRDCACNFILYVYREGALAFLSSDFHTPVSSTAFTRGQEVAVTFKLPRYLLNPGYHSFGFAVVDKGGNFKQIASAQHVLSRKIADDQYRRGASYLLGWNGAVSPMLSVTGRLLN